jgi:hypothetical protein
MTKAPSKAGGRRLWNRVLVSDRRDRLTVLTVGSSRGFQSHSTDSLRGESVFRPVVFNHALSHPVAET